MTRRIVDIAKGVLAIATIAGLLLAVPWLLLRIGGYPGTSLLEAFGDPLASDSTRSAQLLAGTLGLIAWFCWLQVAYALVVEAVAAARGKVTNRASLLPGIQAAAARLVTAATLILSSFGPTATAMAAPLAPMVAFEPALAVSVAAVPTQLVNQPTESAPAVGETYITSDRDTFWSIAETTLGDGLRWREVRDANVGRVLADGTAITSSTEEVAGGSRLQLPADAVAPLSDEAGDAASLDAVDPEGEWIDVENGDHFWSIAEEALAEEWGRAPTDSEIAPYWAGLVEENDGRLLPPGEPNLIYPEQRFHLPDMPADPTAPDVESTPDVEPAPEIETETEVPVTEPDPVATTIPTPTTQAPATAVDASTTPATTRPSLAAKVESSNGSSLPLAAAALGLGSLSVGAGALAVTLRRRRAHQAAKRKPGTTLVPPSEEANDYERRTRPVADTEAARWVEATNKLITSRLAQHKAHRMPAVIAMRAGRFGVEVLLDEACAPIEGFVSGNDDNSAWRLHPDLELRMIEAETEDIQPYCPALVAVGSTEAGDLLLDLEQLGVLSVEGDDEDAAGWYRSIAAGIASSAWSQMCEVVVLGDEAHLAEFAQVSIPADVDVWVDQTVLAMRRLHERLQATPYEQRVAPGEIFHPTIVLIAAEHAEAARKLSEAAALVNSPLAVVAACPLAVAERIHLDPRKSTLEPIGVDFVPSLTPAAEAEVVSELLENAASSEAIEAEDEPSDEVVEPDPEREPVSAVIERVMAPKPIEVRLLCPKPTVDGLGVDPPAKQLSVICYLAYHRSVTSQRLRDTFWPTATSRKTADNAISQVRSILGLEADGENRLTQAINSGEYELSADVGCDWSRAETLINAAKGRPGGERIELLKAGLVLVVGGQIGADAPARQFSWLVEDHQVYGHMELVLLDAAASLGELALEADDIGLATEAAQIGFNITPGNEAMCRLRMRAAARRGDDRGLADAFDEATKSAERMGPWADVEKETALLWERLGPGRRSQAS